MQKKSNRVLLIGSVLGIAIILLLVLLLKRQNHLIMQRAEQHAEMLRKQEILIETKRRSGLMPLMKNLLEQVSAEVEINPSRSISEKLIKQLAILSDSFQPDSYNYVESDSLEKDDLNQERGQLLLYLASMNIDPTSFDQIKKNVSFSKADLEGADLKDLNLSGINLMSAHLKGADLSRVNLSKANLKGANLWGSKLIGANLQEAALNRVDLRWATADSVTMAGADLSGAFLESAKVRNANFSGTLARHAFFNGALFNESVFNGTDLFRTDLRKALFLSVRLTAVDLSEGNISEADFDHATLDSVLLINTRVNEENWLDLLDSWKVSGRKKIQDEYQVVKDASGKANFSIKLIDN
jgi:uncharacterized protein YjbI with pentapeptide repeats